MSALVKDETIWLTQKAMRELFNVNVPAISKHLKNIFDEGELQENATVSILEIVQEEGSRSVKRKVEYYNLDAIISVGYRISSTLQLLGRPLQKLSLLTPMQPKNTWGSRHGKTHLTVEY